MSAEITVPNLSKDQLIVRPKGNVPDRATGCRPTRHDPRALSFARYFLGDTDVKLPKSTSFWKRRTPFPARTFGNRAHGCCTIASQAVAAMRMERKEQARTLNIDTAQVLGKYYAMTEELYGGGDTGAYETDALSRWRDPAKTFTDTNGHPLTIDAFTLVNHLNPEEFKAGIYVAGLMGLNGLKLTLSLPAAWARVDPAPPGKEADKAGAPLNPAHVWDLPRDQDGKPDRAALAAPEWQPYSWGGHSLYADEYATVRVEGRTVLLARLVQTWYGPDDPHAVDREAVRDEQWVTMDGIVAYGGQAHSIVDSVDRWRERVRQAPERAGVFDLAKLVKDVNKASRVMIGVTRRQGRTAGKTKGGGHTTAASAGSEPSTVSER
jgi:hypothetical protein